MRMISWILGCTWCFATSMPAQSLDQRTLPREIADEVVQLYNAAGTRRVDGALSVAADEEIQTDLVVIGGPLTVGGRISGKVIAVNATVELRRGGSIGGDLLIVGGSLTGREEGTVSGSIRTYAAPMRFDREGDRMMWREREEDDRWWRRRDRWRDRGWTDLRLMSARTYNRVEGLPVMLGPVFGREFAWGRLQIDALGVLRSANSFEFRPANVGHSLKTELRFGHGTGLRIGGRHYDLVDGVEPWQLSDTEVGLAAFFLHRDYRDYFNRHGGSVHAGLFTRDGLDVSVSHADERWGARTTNDPFTLFRDTDAWRPNPLMDEGRFRITTASVRYDTRNDDRHPRNGWYIGADYEYGDGTVDRYAPTSGSVRELSPGGLTTWDRLLLDIRSYNRISPDASLNLRVVAGGWLSGDELPLQRRFGLGGPATLPGFDFRRLQDRFGGTATDYLTCSDYSIQDVALPVGTPGECERFAMAQLELRGDMGVDLFGILDGDRDWRRNGWGRGAQWVLFADAGRGWLVGTPDDRRTFSRSTLPPLSSFRTDIGVGLQLDELGLYLAKSLSDNKAPVNFFVRLRPRF